MTKCKSPHQYTVSLCVGASISLHANTSLPNPKNLRPVFTSIGPHLHADHVPHTSFQIQNPYFPPPKPPTKIRYCTSRSRDFHPVTGKPPTRSLRSPALVFGYCETRDKQDPAGERELNLSLNYRRPTIGLATICSRAPAARPNSQTWSGEGESLPCFSNVFRD
jgi:hypothetical protein